MRKVLTFGLILTLTSLTGCSIAFEFYVRNFTDDQYVLKIFSNSKNRLTEVVPDYVLVKNQILEVNGRTGKATIDTLKTAVVGDTLVVEIPPKSTIKLPHFMADYEEIGKLRVDGLLIVDSMRIDSFTIYPSRATGRIKRATGFFQVMDYYDIESNAQ